MRPEERSLDLAEVEHRLQRWAADRGYAPQLQERYRGRWAVWQCQLTTGDGQPVPGGFGVGKGVAPVSRVGALAEATEHLISRQRPALALRSAAAVAEDLAGDVVEPLLREQPDVQLACTPYSRIDVGGEPVELPVGLSQPSYYLDRAPGDTADYQPLRPYMTNSGTALGATRDEALLHALNETVERDALSLLICRAVWGGEQVAVLDPDSLPIELAEQHRHVEHVLAEPVHLLELTTDLDVPVVLAYIAPHSGRRAYGRGLGASLHPRHAASRALAELLQMEIVDGVLDPAELDLLHDLDPLLHVGGRLDLTEHLACAQRRAYRPCPAPESVAEQLAEVTRRVTAAGYQPYYREIDTGTSDLSVVHVAVPGLERIMGLLSGYAALPGPRGLAAIHATQEVPT